ncbi:unnamed protein product [Caenorhabditis bovis]|uniref:Uncharacterized protein n=1 Tax=Caenorhabditis bovis TaxID=2654633 RepID=A0A8S1EKN9_9PELO|nr:unnamed protein product [Caenorhabditis bovis]
MARVVEVDELAKMFREHDHMVISGIVNGSHSAMGTIELDGKKIEIKKAERGLPTSFTPVPSEDRPLLEKMQKSRNFKKKSYRLSPKASLKDIEAPITPHATSPDTSTCVETSLLRTAVPVHIYFQQRRVGSTEVPCDGPLRQAIQFGLDRISKKIKNRFSFYVYCSIYDVKWDRPKIEFMQTPDPENIFRLLLSPSMADYRIQDIAMRMSTSIPKFNIYIFVKSLDDNGTSTEDLVCHDLWKFHHVY